MFINTKIFAISVFLATLILASNTKVQKQNYQIYQKFENNGLVPQNINDKQYTRTVQIQQIYQQDNNYYQEHQDQQTKQEKEKRQKEYNKQFNFYLYYGLIIGSVFLAFALLRAAIRRNRINSLRQVNIERINQAVYQQGVLSQDPHDVHSIQQQINFHSRELQKLKQLKLRRKFQDEQKKNQEERILFTRRKELNQQTNLINQNNRQFVQNPYENPQIYRPSNNYQIYPGSFNQEIPFGRPIDAIPLKQDNNSSFASQYPQI